MEVKTNGLEPTLTNHKGERYIRIRRCTGE